jgi:hypothetical protein
MSMFCPNCGTEANHELNYCKRCGGSLNVLASAPPQAVSAPVSTIGLAVIGATTLLIVIGGLALLSVTLSELSRSDRVTSEGLVWLFIFGALTIVFSVGLLLRFMMRLLAGNQSEPSALSAARPQFRPATNPGEVGPATTANMLPPERPLNSVTEHTTRTFDMHNKRQ